MNNCAHFPIWMRIGRRICQYGRNFVLFNPTGMILFDHGILMVAFVRTGVELAYETKVGTAIVEERAYYESPHETPLIANLIARKKLYEINVISPAPQNMAAICSTTVRPRYWKRSLCVVSDPM